jgi:hypothetical protein
MLNPEDLDPSVEMGRRTCSELAVRTLRPFS